MGSSTRGIVIPRTTDELIDGADSRAAIAGAFDAMPVDDERLRRAVWTFVDTERHAGSTPGEVIVALRNLMTQAQVASLSERSASVILWCVEAYFGHLGEELRRSQSSGVASEPRPASRR
jgi:hypothetical protein